MLNTKKAVKVKLIAIAKDEAAYLPEWIFHHLRVGFASIDIYVNNTSDNTWEIANKLSTETRVNFLNGDPLFKKYPKRPQEGVYNEAVNGLLTSSYTHAMFLDIDEFWMSRDFAKSIKDVVCEFPTNSIIGFGWFIRTNESLFCSALGQKISGRNGSWVKSIFPLDISLERIDVHSVKSEECDYYYANGYKRDGRYSPIKGGGAARLCVPFLDQAPLDSFILHRMHRSEMEYVSMLGRGQPRHSYTKSVYFKANRNGYNISRDTKYVVKYSPNAIQQYQFDYLDFLRNYSLEESLAKGRRFIMKRFDEVVVKIKECSVSEYFVLEQILRNVQVKEVIDAYNSIDKRTITKACKLREQEKSKLVLLSLKELYEELRLVDTSSSISILNVAYKNSGIQGKIWCCATKFNQKLKRGLHPVKKVVFARLKKADKDKIVLKLLSGVKNLELLNPQVAIEVSGILLLMRPNGAMLKREHARLQSNYRSIRAVE